MRASTLFGLTIAILIGMAVVFGVKSAGLFDKKVPVAVNQERPRVLVAKRNLFETLTATLNDVVVREVDDTEMDQFLKNKHKYMPAVPEAANLRIMARDVSANEPLLKEHFQDLRLPGSFGDMLESGMRAVNLQMPKDRAGGGIIRKGDRVDVYLTSNICADPTCSQSFTATAPIGLGLKVIVKRDSIWTMMAPVDDSRPISFTLQANPYRAALIEFAKNKGYLTLVPTGPENTKKPVAMATEGKDEEQRVIDILRGQPITDLDLEDIFKLAPMSRPAVAQAPEPLQVEIFGGAYHRGTKIFPNSSNGNGGSAMAKSRPTIDGESAVDVANYGSPILQSRADGRNSLGYRFVAPGGVAFPASESKVGCATCGKNKK